MGGYAKSFVLLATLTCFFVGVGFMFAGPMGGLIAFAIACAMNIFAWWNSDKVVLKLYKAKPLTAEQANDYYDVTKHMTMDAGMPMPKLYIIENPQPNAFATGRNPENGAVAITTGLIERLNFQEVTAVIAHELAHIQNRDTLIMTITATLAGAISMIANMAMFMARGGRNAPMGMIGVLVVSILAPLAASVVQMAISRSREYEADRIGAQICGRPLWLASALEKIAGKAAVIDNHAAESNPATAHMFIINPLHVHAIDGLFSTHPKTDERVRRLRAMS